MGTVDSLLDKVGGLNGVVEKFESSGLGEKAKSWIGTGANESIDADDVKRALGPKLSEIAAKLGIGEDEAADDLAQKLPDAVDKATPDGSIPVAEATDSIATHTS
jgi:uncharacterized protein YidB (DUF937 family)